MSYTAYPAKAMKAATAKKPTKPSSHTKFIEMIIALNKTMRFDRNMVVIGYEI